MGFDSLPIRSEKDLFDLANWAREQKELAGFLSRTRSGEIAGLLGSSRPPEQLEPGIWEAWSDRFTAYLQKYGHMIYNLDFGYPLPADDPQPMLETFLLFLRGEGIDPYERQRRTSERREEAVRRLTGRLKGRRLRAFQKNIARAQKFAPLREDGLADVGLSYPLLRQMLRELGERLVRDGAIAGRDEVFWLTGDELAASAARLDGGQGLDDLSGLVLERKAVWRAARKANPPMALPQLKVFGRDLLELRATGFRKKPEDILKGVAASPGSVTAAASVLGGPQDFGKMKLGNVLVASLTTPAWTPLFARASAIVTDIGGPLSHGSIVAREYGIPAVLGTGGATSRIRDGQVITVDGEKGEVILAPATAHPQRP
jgi:pyruvate,water dikinase